MVTTFNQKDLTSFGEYLLSDERTQRITSNLSEGDSIPVKERLSQIYHADIENWKDSKSKVQKVRAKFSCNNIESNEDYDNVMIHMSAVTVEGQGENADYSKYTPYGNLEIQVDNNTLGKSFFKEGKDYYIDFTRAKE